MNEEKRQRVIALGPLGWPVRRIEEETGVWRETAGAYLKAASIAIRPMGAWRRRPPAKPANEVSPDSLDPAKPANEVFPGSGAPSTARRLTASHCEPFLEFIELSLAKGRKRQAIWQDLVDNHGFTGRYARVKRSVRNLRSNSTVEPRAVIVTPPGEDYGESRVMVRTRRRPAFGVDRRTVRGRRDYAILLLLVTYGLRAHEVARLTLDDIDWKRERLQEADQRFRRFALKEAGE